jgi:hypothetical protein
MRNLKETNTVNTEKWQQFDNSKKGVGMGYREASKKSNFILIILQIPNENQKYVGREEVQEDST